MVINYTRRQVERFLNISQYTETLIFFLFFIAPQGLYQFLKPKHFYENYWAYKWGLPISRGKEPLSHFFLVMYVENNITLIVGKIVVVLLISTLLFNYLYSAKPIPAEGD